MKIASILLLMAFIQQAFAGSFGRVYSPDDAELENVVSVKCSRVDGRTFFYIIFNPAEISEGTTWRSELTMWKSREKGLVEIHSGHQLQGGFPQTIEFNIIDDRIADSDFTIQSVTKGNPGLFYGFNLEAFAKWKMPTPQKP
jgi:hypothetical protein